MSFLAGSTTQFQTCKPLAQILQLFLATQPLANEKPYPHLHGWDSGCLGSRGRRRGVVGSVALREIAREGVRSVDAVLGRDGAWSRSPGDVTRDIGGVHRILLVFKRKPKPVPPQTAVTSALLRFLLEM